MKYHLHFDVYRLFDAMIVTNFYVLNFELNAKLIIECQINSCIVLLLFFVATSYNYFILHFELYVYVSLHFFFIQEEYLSAFI